MDVGSLPCLLQVFAAARPGRVNIREIFPGFIWEEYTVFGDLIGFHIVGEVGCLCGNSADCAGVEGVVLSVDGLAAIVEVLTPRVGSVT